MRSGSTSSGGTHSHGSRTLTSTNFRNTSTTTLNGSFSGFATTSTVASAGSHDFTTPEYSLGSIDIGSFSGTTNAAPGHSHTVQIVSQGPLRVGTTSWRWRANVSTQSSGTHTHTFDGQAKSILVTNPTQLNALKGTSDFVISAGDFDVDSDGSHSHGVSSFNVNASTSAGSLAFSFPTSSVFTAGSHSHTIDPRFDVVATYNFTAVPEPSTANALAALAMGMLCYRRRHNNLITHS